MASFNSTLVHVPLPEPGRLFPTYLIGILLLPLIAYYYALPRKIPHIPCNAKAARSVLGDVPEITSQLKSTGEITSFFASQCARHASPVAQVFLEPFGKPMIVVSDLREIEDILTRRTKEFDRAKNTQVIFESLLPHATISKLTHDAFRAQRKMWAPAMGTVFLNNVASKHIHSAALELTQLWKQKAILAKGHPLDALEDLKHATVDAIWGVAMGNRVNATQSQLKRFQAMSEVPLPASIDEAVDLSPVGLPPMIDHNKALFESVSIIAVSPFPKLQSFLLRRKKWFQRAATAKDAEMDRLLSECRQNFQKSAHQRSDADVNSAMELVLQREHAALVKSGAPLSRLAHLEMRDELFTFLLAGYETTSTTLAWAVKYMSTIPTTQQSLRQAIRHALPHASGSYPPSAEDIIAADIPYLEAFITELLRVCRTAGATVREAVVDTYVLGYFIPKGSNIFLVMTADPCILEKDMPVDETCRSPSSQQYRRYAPPWPLEGKHDFRPERWLKTVDGKECFDDNAGPTMAFSAGVRACYGKKLALMEMRIILILLVLSFEFQPVPASLNSWSATERITRQPSQSCVRLSELA